MGHSLVTLLRSELNEKDQSEGGDGREATLGNSWVTMRLNASSSSEKPFRLVGKYKSFWN